MKRVAFLGTGIMGLPMASRLCAAGHVVKVWNRSGDKAMPLVQHGAKICGSAGEAAAAVDIVILMLSTGEACDDVLFGRHGVADVLRSGATVIVMSSIPVGTARSQAARLAARGIGYLDAPVSGGERGAINGTLTIMVGGDEDVLKQAQPVLESMGRVTHVGAVGCGQLAKIANQVIVGITIGAVAEAFILAEKGGVDLIALKKALSGGFADSTILQQHSDRMITGNFTPGGTAEIQLKDLHTAQALVYSLGFELPFLSLAEALYGEMCKTPRAKLDHSALYLEIKDRAA